jgi:DNA-binding MarR family transcriptional regulator
MSDPIGWKMRRSSQAPLGKASYEALADFRFALRNFLAFSEKAAAAAGLTAQQHQAMLAIRGAPEGESLTIGQIASRLMIRHHTAVELVDRLAAMVWSNVTLMRMISAASW